jgi:hypothetical protein
LTDLEIAGPGLSQNSRKGWLLFFGILEMLVGAGAGLLGLLILVVFLFMERLPTGQIQPGSSLRMAVMACFYGGVALFFLAAGIGTIRRRPWARILMLVVSSLWLVMGLMATLVFLFLWPTLSRGISEKDPTASGGVMVFTLVLIIGTLFSLYVLLPASFLIFYTRKSVKAAFVRGEAGEPVASHRPLPLLALCVWVTICALGTLISLAVNVQVVFSIILTGAPAFGLTLVLAAAQGWLARGLYRLEPRAWWGTLVFYLLMGVSGFVTFYRVPMAELIERQGFDLGSQQGAEQILSAVQSFMPALMVAVNLLLLSLILFVKRYFRANEPPEGLPAIG